MVKLLNSKSENQGSAKVFCFGHMHSLSRQEKCFIALQSTIQSVLEYPEDERSHLNIRSFMKTGWKGF